MTTMDERRRFSLAESERTTRAVVTLTSKFEAPDLKNALEVLLDGPPIRPAETKAFGCAIQRN